MLPEECGLAPLNPSVAGKARIVGGQTQIYGHNPAYVRIQAGNVQLNGALVTNQHVLTVRTANRARDVDLDSMTVYLGDHERNANDQFEQQFDVIEECSVKRNGPNANDWSLLTLDRKVQPNDHIQPACLPASLGELGYSRCKLVGGGRQLKPLTIFGKPTFWEYIAPAKYIQELPVRHVGCPVASGHDDSLFCWKGKANDGANACSGDHGAPIMCLDSQNRWTLAGLHSENIGFSLLCNGISRYTNVAFLIDQIKFACKLYHSFEKPANRMFRYNARRLLNVTTKTSYKRLIETRVAARLPRPSVGSDGTSETIQNKSNLTDGWPE